MNNCHLEHGRYCRFPLGVRILARNAITPTLAEVVAEVQSSRRPAHNHGLFSVSLVRTKASRAISAARAAHMPLFAGGSENQAIEALEQAQLALLGITELNLRPRIADD